MSRILLFIVVVYLVSGTTDPERSLSYPVTYHVRILVRQTVRVYRRIYQPLWHSCRPDDQNEADDAIRHIGIN